MKANSDTNTVKGKLKPFLNFLAKYSVFIIGSIYVLAILCVNAIPLQILVSLAPILYLLGAGFIFLCHQRPLKNMGVYFLVAILLGLIIEIINVQTNAVFGSISFGGTLGIKFLGTPLLIGFHWFLLSIGAAYFTSWIFNSRIMKILGASFLMIIAFSITDPVAQSLDFWTWDNYSFTLQNYSIRFLVSIVLQVILVMFLKEEKNPFAGYFYIITTLFFIIANIVL